MDGRRRSKSVTKGIKRDLLYSTYYPVPEVAKEQFEMAKQNSKEVLERKSVVRKKHCGSSSHSTRSAMNKSQP